jgi:hypothetical protein
MLEKLVIWFFCAFCMMRTDQEFKYDDGIYEIYECQLCNHENRVAVR